MITKNHYFRGLIFVSVWSFAISSMVLEGPANAASSPKTITTCTNIKSNVMRLLTKGSCNKKTERTRLWIPKPSATPKPSPKSSDLPNLTKFNEYFSDIYLGKMNLGKVIGTDGFPTKTTTFTKGVDLFCTMMSIKKTISAQHIANAIYDVAAKNYVQPKTYFPAELAAGGSGGCSSLDQPKGTYQDRIYIDDVLVAILPFDVK